MIKDEVKFLVSNIRYKEVNDINLLTKYFWSIDDLLVRISTLEKSEDILSKESKNNLHICKEILLSLQCSVRDRFSKIMISIYQD
jgi:hypothetical protein